jgi:hypothetical protein
MSNHNQFPISENPLAGDVDRWVSPNETRSDEQIAYDERVASRMHMSGGDGVDEYWADYDEYFGTVNGGENSKKTVAVEVKELTLVETPGTWEYLAAQTRTVLDIDGCEHKFYGPSHEFQGRTDEDIAADLRDRKLKRQADEERQAYWDEQYELEQEGITEDPLAGDVDH